MTARVLVVDDVEPNVRLLEAKLQHEYYTVTSAFSGEQAIEAALRENPDVILLDVMMPGLDGFETCRRLKEDTRTSHIPVIMVTALDQRTDRIKGLSVGADDFLSKPIDDVALLARVRSLSRYKALLDELRTREAVGQKYGVIDHSGAHDSGLGANILIFEDDKIRGVRMKACLEPSQHAHIWDDAIPLAEEAQRGVELLIVSTSGASFDGLRLAAHVRSQSSTRNIPILAIVGADDSETALRALDLGVNDIIIRPIDEEELQARVRTLIKRKRYIEGLRSSVDQSMEKAVTDILTGLHNRRYMESQLKALIERAKRGGGRVSVMIADIDHFKRVNDLYGHDAGDDVIKQFGERLSANFRPRDLTCRYGGEEFVIIMPDTKLEEAMMVAERLRRSISSQPFFLGRARDQLKITCSVGVAKADQDSDTPETVLKRADEALYAAKQNGRNCVMSSEAVRE